MYMKKPYYLNNSITSITNFTYTVHMATTAWLRLGTAKRQVLTAELWWSIHQLQYFLHWHWMLALQHNNNINWGAEMSNMNIITFTKIYKTAHPQKIRKRRGKTWDSYRFHRTWKEQSGLLFASSTTYHIRLKQVVTPHVSCLSIANKSSKLEHKKTLLVHVVQCFLMWHVYQQGNRLSVPS